ncbi:MAG: YjgP/YjgQ family permease [Rickettsiaceae bacterium]|nr:YjgP/YjgQ family permease [Rickettsiaceae bacterium]
MKYKKYIIQTIFSPLIISTITLTSLVWIIQVSKLLYLIDKGIQIQDFLQLIALILPFLLFIILPLVTVLSVIYVYLKLKDERQIIIFQSSGFNDYTIIKPALIVATIITILSYYISIHLMPLSYNKLKLRLKYFKNSYVSNLINVKTFTQLSKHITIYIDKKYDNGLLEGIILFDNRKSDNKSVFFAKSGRVVFDGQNHSFNLSNGFRQAYDKANNLTRLFFSSLQIELNENGANDYSNHTRNSLELYIHEMLWPDPKLPQKEQNKLIVEGHQRIIWPLYNYAFVFLALAVFLKQPYNRRARIKPVIIASIPLVLISYIHFTLQKMAYKDTNYVIFCYLNLFLTIIYSIWQTTRRVI